MKTHFTFLLQLFAISSIVLMLTCCADKPEIPKEQVKKEVVPLKSDPIPEAPEITQLKQAMKQQEEQLSQLKKAAAGHKVYQVGCRDLFILEYNEQFIVAQDLGMRLGINKDDILNCEIAELGIIPAENITGNAKGKIKVLSIASGKEQAEEVFTVICKEYVKGWKWE